MSAVTQALAFRPVERGCLRVSEHWCAVRDGDVQALELFRRHYSCQNPARKLLGGNFSRFAGQGKPIILLSLDADALFVWRKEVFRLDKQEGVNCSVFRNEGRVLSSLLIREAMVLAWERWPDDRLFTFVDAEKTGGGRSSRRGRGRRSAPGQCFLHAGWTLLDEGTKNHGHRILEVRPTRSPDPLLPERASSL